MTHAAVSQALQTRPASVTVLDEVTGRELRTLEVANRAAAHALAPEPGTTHIVSVYVLDLVEAAV